MILRRVLTAALLLVVVLGAQSQAPAQHPASSGTRSETTAEAGAPADDLIDINRATAAELRTLPGVGEAYSLAIVKRRPYKNKSQLRSKGVIPLAAYRKIKDKIIARQ